MSDVTLDGVLVERDGRVVLDVPSLRLRGRRTTAVIGPNGSGKTTLLRVIAGLEKERAGRVSMGGSPIALPQQLAYVFQEDVFLRRRVRENLALGLHLRGVGRMEARQRIEEAATLLGIVHLLDRRADHLSGGEGRRVSFARALCLRAPLVLLDEPLAGLDERSYAQLLDDLPRIVSAFDATTVLVTHSRHEALRVAQDLVVLVAAQVRAAGGTREVTANPGSVAVAEALSYSVVAANGGSVAIPPGALKVGPGAMEFTMTIDEVLDVMDLREVRGRIGETRVRAAWTDATRPAHGAQVLVHAEWFCHVD